MSILSGSAIAGADQSVSVRSASTAPSDNNANSSESLENEFLTLLVAQIQNQDPLNPTDGTEYVAQLAQFSQVSSLESLVNLSQENRTLINDLSILSTTQFAGKTVSVNTNQISTSEQDVIDGQINLLNPTNNLTLEILDYAGNTVKSIDLGAQSQGNVDFSLDMEALELSGDYILRASIDSQQDYTPDISISGLVNNVKLPTDGGNVMLEVQGIGSVPIYALSSIGS